MSLTTSHRPAQQIDGPWLSDKRWRGGRVRDSTGGGVLFWWAIALIGNLVLARPIIYGLRTMGQHKGEILPNLLVMFLAVALIALAVWATAISLRFGWSYLALETLPGAVGGWLVGTVRTGAKLHGLDCVRLTLRCVRRVTTGHGKRRHTREQTLWESEQVLGGRLPPDREGGHAIPVAFQIPADAEPTRDQRGDDIVWRLRVHAPLPGTDYSAIFVVPIYAVAQPDGFVPHAEHEAAKERAPRAAVAVLDGSKIDIVTNAAGRKRFVFPASRRRTTAMVVTAIASALLALTWAILDLHGPGFFAVIMGLIGLLFAWHAYVYWFRHVEFNVNRRGIEHRWRVFPFARTRRLDTAEIVGIEDRATTTLGDKPFHTVFANVADKFDSLRLVSGLRPADAEHVREEVLAALGQHVDHAQRAHEQTDHAVDREEREPDL